MKGSQSLAQTQSEYNIPKSCPFPSSSILVLPSALNALAKREESAGRARGLPRGKGTRRKLEPFM